MNIDWKWKAYTEAQAQKYCKSHGWTDLFVQSGTYYAYPPSAVMPLRVPVEDQLSFRLTSCLLIGGVLAIAAGLFLVIAATLWFLRRSTSRYLIGILITYHPTYTSLLKKHDPIFHWMCQLINLIVTFNQGIIALGNGLFVAKIWLTQKVSLRMCLIAVLR